MEKETDQLELPLIFVTALKAYSFSRKPIWRIGEGLEHVKVELTYTLPTTHSQSSVEQKENLNVNSKETTPVMSKRGGGADARTSLHLPICLPNNLSPDNSKTPQRQLPPPPASQSPEKQPTPPPPKQPTPPPPPTKKQPTTTNVQSSTTAASQP